MTQIENEQKNITSAMPVIAASYLGPALIPNRDGAWEEARLPMPADDLVQEIMGQPMRRAGRFIKLVCCGALTCLKSMPPEELKNKKIGIFLATGLGNVDEILPFIKQVFKHDGGFPSPNQFANSVSNAAAFFLARICEVKGVVLTISQEELSFESALWLAQSYLANGEIDLAMVGGCDVFTPTVDDYRERMNLTADNARQLAMGEGSSWLLLGNNGPPKKGDILAVEFNNKSMSANDFSANAKTGENCAEFLSSVVRNAGVSLKDVKPYLLPGFRLRDIDAELWRRQGWIIDDYLLYCGIHPTAAAFGLARAILSGKNGLYVHYNCHASGKQALVAVVTE
ncbi:MAG: beta-ketoacyl synthase N-terminal-like domain-containing protein [Smithellaceae bacterium]